tara:strand:+ start:470 stop:970 length:501 start_codon:yes stop_codon:yes gene_type:complete
MRVLKFAPLIILVFSSINTEAQTQINERCTRVKGDGTCITNNISDTSESKQIKEDSIFYLKLGIEEKNQKNFIAAKKAFDKSIRYDPNNAETYVNRGYVNRKLGYFDAAMNDYDKAIDINPKYSFSYRARGYLKELNGKVKEACIDYKKAQKYGDKDVQKRMSLIC